jgi:hypothetical protein
MIDAITGINGIRSVGGWNQLPYFNMNFNMIPDNTNTPNQGDVRYNGATQKTECWNNGAWIPLSSGHVTVELTPDVTEVIDWAKKKMVQDRMIEELAKNNPSVASAVNQLDTLVSLLKNQDESKKD